MRPSFPIVALVALGLVAAGGGCAEDFAPYNRLETLRVLAIQGDPAVPAPGEATTLTPLVHTLPDEPVIAWSWSWCPFPGPAQDGYPCLVTEEQLAALAGGGVEIPPFDLGQDPTAALEHTVPPALLALLCEGTPGSPALLDCTGGFPVQIRLQVQTSAELVDAVHTVRLRLDEETQPNHNPMIDGLAVVLDDEEHAVGAEPTITIPRRQAVELRLQVPEEAAERYVGVDEDGQPEERREQLTFTWFVETGTTRLVRTSFIEGALELEVASRNEWTPGPEEEYPHDTAWIAVVVRDERGGTGWWTGAVRLGGDR